MVNFGSSWLKGRLICFVAQQTIQPVLAEGWTGLEDGALNLLETRHPISPSSHLEHVIQQGVEAFGRTDDFDLSKLFIRVGLNTPEQVLILPLKISNKTKILFIAQPAFSMDDPELLSTQSMPLVTLAHDIGAKLEDMIRLSKIGKLPEVGQRIPDESDIIMIQDEGMAGPIEFFLPSKLPASSDFNERLESTSEASHVGEYVRHFDKTKAESVVYRTPTQPHQAVRKQPTKQPANQNKQPASPETHAPRHNPLPTREQVSHARETITSGQSRADRPVPVSFDSSVHARREKESSGVNIMMPIGVEDDQAQSKQTLLGGFSAEEVLKANQEQQGAQSKRAYDTLQGFSVKPERPPSGLVHPSSPVEDSPTRRPPARSSVYKVVKPIKTVVHRPGADPIKRSAPGEDTHSKEQRKQ